MFLYYFLILSLPLTQHWLLGAGGDLTVVKYVGLACLPFAIFRSITRHRPQGLKLNGVALAFFCYLSIGVMSYFVHGGRLALGASGLMNVSSMLLFCVVTFGLVDSAGRLYRV